MVQNLRKLCLAIAFFTLTVHKPEAFNLSTHILPWTVLPGISVPYSIWSSVQKFSVNDNVVFVFAPRLHTVAEVTKEGYDTCNATEIISIEASSPATFNLQSAGEHYYICTVAGHCPMGQKVAISVSDSPPPPVGRAISVFDSPPPPVAVLPTSSRRDVAEFVVGDTLGWRVPPGGPHTYSNWATTKTFSVGDTLVFNFVRGEEDVARVTKEAFDTCNISGNNSIKLEINGAAKFTFKTSGEYYFAGTKKGRCKLGQKLAVKVNGPANGPVTHIVGDGYGWAPPPAGSSDYAHWASNMSFHVGDKLVFNFVEKLQDVALVSKWAYDNCDTSTNTNSVLTTSPVTVTLNNTGDYYFTTTNPSLCNFGQQLAITVRSPATTVPPI